MGSKYSEEQKLAAVRAYLDGEGGIRQIARAYDVSRGALIQWAAFYKQYGCLPSPQNLAPQANSAEEKQQFKLEVLYWQQTHDASDLKTAVEFRLKGMEIVSKWRKEIFGDGARLFKATDGSIRLSQPTSPTTSRTETQAADGEQAAQTKPVRKVSLAQLAAVFSNR